MTENVNYYGTFWMSVPIWLWDQRGREIAKINSEEARIICAVIRHIGHESDKGVGRKTIASSADISVRTLDRYCKKLEKNNILKVIRDGHSQNDYYINMEKIREISHEWENKMSKPIEKIDEKKEEVFDGVSELIKQGVKEGVAKKLYLQKGDDIIKEQIRNYTEAKKELKNSGTDVTTGLLVSSVKNNYAGIWWKRFISDGLKKEKKEYKRLYLVQVIRLIREGKFYEEKGCVSSKYISIKGVYIEFDKSKTYEEIKDTKSKTNKIYTKADIIEENNCDDIKDQVWGYALYENSYYIKSVQTVERIPYEAFF